MHEYWKWFQISNWLFLLRGLIINCLFFSSFFLHKLFNRQITSVTGVFLQIHGLWTPNKSLLLNIPNTLADRSYNLWGILGYCFQILSLCIPKQSMIFNNQPFFLQKVKTFGIEIWAVGNLRSNHHTSIVHLQIHQQIVVQRSILGSFFCLKAYIFTVIPIWLSHSEI